MRELHPCRLICQWGTGTEESGWQTCRTCQFSDKCPPPDSYAFFKYFGCRSFKLQSKCFDCNWFHLLHICMTGWNYLFFFSRLYETLHASHMKRPAWVFILLMLRVWEHVTTSSRRVRGEYIHLWFVKKVPSLSLFWVFFYYKLRTNNEFFITAAGHVWLFTLIRNCFVVAEEIHYSQSYSLFLVTQNMIKRRRKNPCLLGNAWR